VPASPDAKVKKAIAARGLNAAASIPQIKKALG
jgi:hypothetical protein